MKRLQLWVIMVMTGMLLSACASSSSTVRASENDYIYKGINFGEDRDVSFKQGVQDGCRTASGTYVKNHEAFNTNRSYRDGWGDGRLQCNGR